MTVDGKHLQFDVPTAGMSFYGTIHGSEISGALSQYGASPDYS
jgi:hypothetical protein